MDLTWIQQAFEALELDDQVFFRTILRNPENLLQKAPQEENELTRNQNKLVVEGDYEFEGLE